MRVLHPLRQRARILSALAAAGFVALWFGSFASACMAAAGPACEQPGSECARRVVSVVATPCEQAMAPCEQPSLNAPIAGKFQFAFAPTLPAPALPVFTQTAVRHTPPRDWQATRPPPTPLYLTYLSLLN